MRLPALIRRGGDRFVFYDSFMIDLLFFMIRLLTVFAHDYLLLSTSRVPDFFAPNLTLALRAMIRTAGPILALAVWVAASALAYAQQAEPRGKTSHMPTDITESFTSIMARMVAAKPVLEREHADLFTRGYDLADRPAQGVTMSRGKPVQEESGCGRDAGIGWLLLFWGRPQP
jgi:hypothetical protein